MAKYNTTKKSVTATVNKEGGLAYQPSMKLELMLRTMSFLMSGDSYYADEKETSDRISALVKLITKNDPLFVLKLARYARQKMYLRTVPMYLLVEYAKTGAKTPAKAATKKVKPAAKKAKAKPAKKAAAKAKSNSIETAPASA